MDVATKGWAAALRDDPQKGIWSPLFWVSFVTQAGFFVISKWGMIYGCSRCDVLIFVPLNIVLNIFFAVAAGMVVLGEAAQVPSARSWFGLLASWLCVVTGILMLVSGPAGTQDEFSLKPERPADEAQSDSGATDDTTDAEEPVALERVTSDGNSGNLHSSPAFWLFITKSSAIARLNRAHITAAHTRRRWRQQVLGHLYTRKRFATHPESPESSADGDSDSSDTPAELREVC